LISARTHKRTNRVATYLEDGHQVIQDDVHRMGCTTRAGVTREAVPLVMPEDRSQWHIIYKNLQKRELSFSWTQKL
jgi:superfamily II DNA/RNA helicase